MKHFLNLLFICLSMLTIAQTKKEQVELLTIKVDSLNLVLNKNQNDLTSKSLNLNALEKSIDSLKQINNDLNKSLIKLNHDLTSINVNLTAEKKLNNQLKKEIDSLTILTEKRKNYLDKLPIGLKLKDENDEQGQSCSSDIDGDGISDLVVLLFAEEGGGIITIFLSSNFYTDNSYQSFGWIWQGNYLVDFSCDTNLFNISGGSESQGLFEQLHLIYSLKERKMIVESYESSSGKTSFNRLEYKILK